MWYKRVEVSICASIRLINYKGVVSSVTIISTGTKKYLRGSSTYHEQSYIARVSKLESAVSKRWYIHNVKPEILVS